MEAGLAGVGKHSQKYSLFLCICESCNYVLISHYLTAYNFWLAHDSRINNSSKFLSA